MKIETGWAKPKVPPFLGGTGVPAPPRQFQPPHERGGRGDFCAILHQKCATTKVQNGLVSFLLLSFVVSFRLFELNSSKTP